ncbi:MAG: restriction endonuclease subunit S [Methanobacterium sp.]
MPELRFPEFEDEWKKKKLKDVAIINPKSQDLPNEFLYIDLESVKCGKLKKENYITKEQAPSRAQRLLKDNDILYQTVRPYQKNNLYFMSKNLDKCVASTGYAQIRCKEDSKFVYQYLHTDKFVNRVLSRCTGTSYPAISSTDLGKIKIKIPSLPEQEKIASFLSKVDLKIEKLERKVELWQFYKKGMLQQLFSQELRFKAGDESDFPDWEIKFLGEISDIKTGNKDLKDKIDKGKYPFFVRSDNIERINSYSFDGEAILIPGDGKIGEVYHYITGKFDYHQRVYKISDFQEKINGKYIYYYLRRHFLRQALKNSVKATVDSLRLPTIKGMEIELPSLPEQTKIADFLTSIDNKIESIQKELQLNKEFKKGLLQKMFPEDKKSKEIKTPDLLDKQTEQTALL